MIFNYNTLQVNLDTENKAINVELNRPDEKNAINVEMLFELEGFLGWLTSHLEVNTVVIGSTSNYFSTGLDQKELKVMSEEKLKKYLIRFQKLVHSFMHLPQTLIVDFKDGAQGMGIELGLGADIRISSTNAVLDFNSLESGWVPCSGGVSLLSELVGVSKAKQWTLSGAQVEALELAQSGLILKAYQSTKGENLPLELCERIARQSAIARIQTKRSFLEKTLPETERGFEYESAFAWAGLSSLDWKAQTKDSFTPAREFAEKIKKMRPKHSPSGLPQH